MKCMILFTKYDFIYKMLYVGDGRKNIETKKEREKIPRLVALPSPFYDMEADCFPESENADIKPDLP